MPTPAISVVIPAYNAGRLAAEAVRSVLAQSLPVSEVLVVDDGSTDDTASLLSEFAAPVRVSRRANGGVAAARNTGVAAATGEWVAFLDADDVWHPRKLERQFAALAASPHLGLLATDCYDWPGDVPPLPDSVPPAVAIRREDLMVRNSIVTSTVVVRRDVLAKVGEFDTAQHGTEDHDLWLRVSRETQIGLLPLKLSGYRTGTPGSLSKNAERMEAGMRIILGKLDAAGEFRGRPLLRRKVWAYFHYVCGFRSHRAGDRGTAVRHLMASLAKYPLPYPKADVRYTFGRPRLLLAALRGGRA